MEARSRATRERGDQGAARGGGVWGYCCTSLWGIVILNTWTNVKLRSVKDAGIIRSDDLTLRKYDRSNTLSKDDR